MPTPTEMRKEVDRLIANGEMPSLDQVLDAVAAARKKYVPEIKKVREDNKKGE